MGVMQTTNEDTVKRPRLAPQATDYLGDTYDVGKPACGAAASVAPATGVPLPDALLPLYRWLDRVSGGKGPSLARLLAFLIVGGSASLVNLICVFLLHRIIKQHNTTAAVVLISAISTEISLVYNFYLNDRFTFRALIDGRRTWLQRLMRFHVPAMVGFVLTLAISSGLWTFVKVNGDHLSPTVSQAIAIVFVTGVNFVMHRFWTYRQMA